MNWDKIRHFRPDEFKEDYRKVSPDLIRYMDALREYAEVPIIIHEAWASGGHSENSYHYSGLAVDFHFGGSLSPLTEFSLILSLRVFGGVGYYPGWNNPGWHVDLRSDVPVVFWHRLNKRYFYGLSSLIRILDLC